MPKRPISTCLIILLAFAQMAAFAAMVSRGLYPPAPALSDLRLGNRTGERDEFEIAADELWWSGKPQEVFRFLPVTNAAALQARAAAERLVKTGEFAFVVYPRSQPRSLWNRRILTRQVLARVASTADLSRLAKTSQAVDHQPLAFAAGWVLFESPAMEGAPALAERLRQLPEIIAAEPVLARQAHKKFIPNDPRFAQQWNFLNTGQNGGTAGVDLRLTNVWDAWQGSGVTIAIVDDGLQTTHPDLAPNVSSLLGYDFYDADADPNPGLFSDTHGTAVAGLAGARGNNALGICGAAPQATLAGLRLISGPTTDAQEAAALSHRLQELQIMNCSWGAGDGSHDLQGPGPLTRAALKNGAENGRAGKGTIYVFAAGNGRASGDDANADGYVNSIYTIAVGTVSDQGGPTSYSEAGACLHVVAPSGSAGRQYITTTDVSGSEGDDPGDYTADFGGTSAAVPMVSGVIALMLQANPALGWRDVQEILLRSARQVDPVNAGWGTNQAGFHFNPGYGAGLMDAAGALSLATNWLNLGAQTNFSTGQSNLTLAIPDNDTNGLIIDLPVTNGALRLEQAALTISLSHPNRNDLEIELIAPSGTKSRLLPAGSLTGVDIADWTFSTVRNWGENGAGVWKVKITDTHFLQVGTVNALRLDLYGTVLPPPSWAIAYTNAAFALTVTGTPNQTYQIETSTNLASWSDYSVLQTTNGMASFVVTNNWPAKQFYRARWLPQ